MQLIKSFETCATTGSKGLGLLIILKIVWYRLNNFEKYLGPSLHYLHNVFQTKFPFYSNSFVSSKQEENRKKKKLNYCRIITCFIARKLVRKPQTTKFVTQRPTSQHRNLTSHLKPKSDLSTDPFIKTPHTNPMSQVFHALRFLERRVFIPASISLLIHRNPRISSLDLAHISGLHQSKKLHPPAF